MTDDTLRGRLERYRGQLLEMAGLSSTVSAEARRDTADVLKVMLEETSKTSLSDELKSYLKDLHYEIDKTVSNDAVKAASEKINAAHKLLKLIAPSPVDILNELPAGAIIRDGNRFVFEKNGANKWVPVGDSTQWTAENISQPFTVVFNPGSKS